MNRNSIAPAEVVHDRVARRFEATIDGQHCEASYEMIGGVMWLTHTGVPRRLQGRGIAAALVQAALDHARAKRLKVRPACSYVHAYMRRHAETLDLIDSA